MSKQKFLIAAGPLLLILFIDGMGLGLVFPILNDLIIDPHNQFITISLSENLRNLIYGLIIGIFMICWFFGAPFLGDLSDQIGRKKSLLICLIGSCLGYLLSGIGVSLNSLALLVFGRIVAGFTSGSQPIAQASIIDISSPDEKTRNIGFILLSLSLGFIFGPLIGGFLSNQSLVPWFNFSLPFYFAAFISILNAMLLQLCFHETFSKKNKLQLKWHRAIEIFVSAFKHHRIRNLSLIFLVMIFGWSSYYSFISMYLLKKYAFSSLEITLFMAAMGIGFGIGNGFFANYLAKRYSLKSIVIAMTSLGSIGIFITFVAAHSIYSWILIIPIATVLSSAYSIILTIFSNQVDAASQGWVMGITGALIALTFGIDGVLLGFLSNLNINYPIIISVAGLAMTTLLMVFYRESSDVLSVESSSNPIFQNTPS